jgi:TRL-like protein family
MHVSIEAGSRRRRFLAITLFTSLHATGCAHSKRAPVPGFLFSLVTAGEAVTSVDAMDAKGESCAHSVLGLFSWGDASIQAARVNGNVGRVSILDGKSMSILGLYARYCLSIRGERRKIVPSD